MRKRLHIAENGSAGGGEAGCGLENRIYCERNLAAEHERQGTGHGQHQPAQRDCHKAFACVELGVFRLVFTQNACADHTNQCGGDIGRQLGFAVNDRGKRGQQQEQGLNAHQPADQIADDCEIHFSLLPVVGRKIS